MVKLEIINNEDRQIIKAVKEFCIMEIRKHINCNDTYEKYLNDAIRNTARNSNKTFKEVNDIYTKFERYV
ncbi:hypothetical protein CMI40_00075 [Candidatus Pacearchaeota archaeon]|jgi:hypothetical protein|nr:hypothetical protein [Candidatus Pacearchaeota archaeon]|tara:strand:- start:3727 stop:3936 length:210 start_codon:yes stop_codon:yes gene_type:complete